MKTVAILQPGYLPWLGFFEMAVQSDVFILYDNVQYDKNGWRNRNRIKTIQGWKWLTVPVKVHNLPLIKDVKIDYNSNWQKKHITTLQQSYSKAPFFKQVMPLLESSILTSFDTISELDKSLIEDISRFMGIPNSKYLFASELNIELSDNKTEKLVNLCRYFNAERYYATQASECYIEKEMFYDCGITLEFQNYCHPRYYQLGNEFVSHLSIVDLIFNEGPNSLKTLTQGEKK